MAAPIIAQAGAARFVTPAPAQNSTSVTLVCTGLTAGNLLSIRVLSRGSASNGYIVSITGAGNAVNDRASNFVDPAYIGFFDCIITTGGSQTITVNKNGNVCELAIEAIELAGVGGAIVNGSPVFLGGSSTVGATSSITTTVVDTFIVAGYASSTPQTVGAIQAGWTGGLDLTGAVVGKLASGYRTATTAGSYVFGWPNLDNAFGRTWQIGSLAYIGAPVTPVLTTPGLSNLTDSSVTVSATSNVTGGTIFAALTTSNVSPSAAQIKAAAGGGIVAAGSGSLVSGVNNIVIIGLTGSTTYYAWIVADNGAESNIVTTGSFITLVPQPTVISVDVLSPQVNSTLVITGLNLGATQGSVTIGGQIQTITAWSNNSISITVSLGNFNKYGQALSILVTTAASLVSGAFNLTAILPQAGWNFIDVGTLAPIVDRLSSTPDLAIGDQIAYDSRNGKVSVYSDGSFSYLDDGSFSYFDFSVWTPGENYGPLARQTLSAPPIAVIIINS